MSEEFHVRKETPLPSGLIPMPVIDFTKPWSGIVNDVNANLISQRYQPLRTNVPLSCVMSDHSSPKPLIDNIDPVRVHFNLLHEEYDTKEHAVAKLGLQAAYWTGLAQVMHQELFPYEEWQRYTTVPVVQIANQNFLIHHHPNTVQTIQYGGDGDMKSYARDRALRIKGTKVPFAELGIDETLLDEYLDYREKIDKAESRADKTAILDFRKTKPEVWDTLKRLFPKIDNVIESTEQFNFMYRAQVDDLTTDLIKPESSPSMETTNLIYFLTDAVSKFLYMHTRPYYGYALRRDPDFQHAIKGLGEVTSIMYYAGKDFW